MTGRMRRWRWNSRVCAMLPGAILLSLTLSSTAWPLSQEPFEISPELILEQRFDSNIFLGLDNGHTAVPAYEASSLRVVPLQVDQALTIRPFLAYFAEALALPRNPQENFQAGGVMGGVVVDRLFIRSDEHLSFSAWQRFRRLSAVTSAEQSDLGPRNHRAENVLNVDLGYFLNHRDEFYLGYNRLDFDQRHMAPLGDRQESLILLTYLRRLRATLSGLLEYGYGWVDFTNLEPHDPDFSSRTHRIAIGIRGDPDARFSGMVKIGAEWRRYDRGGESTQPFVSGDLTYRLSSKLRVNLLASKAILGSSNQRFSSYDATITRLRLTQQLSPHLSGFFEGGMELDAFTDHVETRTDGPAKRVDHLYEVGVGAEYVLTRWLTMGFSYLCRVKNSNVTTLDFVDNRAILRFGLRF